MSEKRYYWIKLKTDFFNLPEIDWLLSQKNGAEYIVLYQMLCLMTANNNGELSSKFGEMIIPYDVDKIVRDTKYFDFDTVKIALELYKKLGLVYESENDMLRISKYEEMIGGETCYAIKQRKYRENKLPPLKNGTKRLNREMLMLPNGSTRYIDEKRYGGNGALAIDLAHGKCEICGSEENIVIHHNNGTSNEIEDLYCLCRKCHGKVESGGYTLSTHSYTNTSTQEIDIEKEIDKDLDIDKDINTIACTEESEQAEQPVICIPLNDNSEYPIYFEFVQEMQSLYPNVDVMAELRKMRGWSLSNPTKRKTKRGVKKFINNWLAKEQDKGNYTTQVKQSKQSNNPYLDWLKQMEAEENDG